MLKVLKLGICLTSFCQSRQIYLDSLRPTLDFIQGELNALGSLKWQERKIFML